MAKIDGKYAQPRTEDQLAKIEQEDSITKLQHMIPPYLAARIRQVERILANIEDDDIDLTMVIEQLWEDLMLAKRQLNATMLRSDFFAKYHGIKD